ncbi:hypothetical protein VP01_779g2 [Puccinia sorghi]|uniref:Uncharacterized protein n=1 Tax=Puccinia sorghi TaxID=27349 RepID=A0A0L6UDB3_9BASI|nr:hypothetical protein VP01_779g2 [Puccinia sorghi]
MTPGSKIYPKGSKGRLIGYNEELRSYRILADDGRIVDTKSTMRICLKSFKKNHHQLLINSPMIVCNSQTLLKNRTSSSKSPISMMNLMKT